jgi:hypothetical protein
VPSIYFENDGLRRLELIFERAMAMLERHRSASLDIRDVVAARIFSLAAEGEHADEYILEAALDGLIPDKAPGAQARPTPD